MTAARRLTLALVLATSALACARVHPHAVTPPPTAGEIAASEWPAARTAAEQAMVRGSFTRADSVLRAFTARYPGTEAASDAMYYRALFRLDPIVGLKPLVEATRDARAGFDAYIAGGAMQTHYAEALTLRRVIANVDSLRSAVDVVRTMIGPPSPERDTLRVRDEELARLKLELEQTKAELDRLRRRLTPRP